MYITGIFYKTAEPDPIVHRKNITLTGRRRGCIYQTVAVDTATIFSGIEWMYSMKEVLILENEICKWISLEW